MSEWETEHEWGRGRERGRHGTWSRLQALSCQPRSWRGARTHEQWDHDLSRSWRLKRLSHPGAPYIRCLNALCGDTIYLFLFTCMNSITRAIFVWRMRQSSHYCWGVGGTQIPGGRWGTRLGHSYGQRPRSYHWVLALHYQVPATSVGRFPNFLSLGFLLYKRVIIIPTSWGTWVAQLAKRPTLDFSSGHELTVGEIEPHFGLCAGNTEPAWDSLSLFSCPSLSLSLSVRLSQNKK